MKGFLNFIIPAIIITFSSCTDIIKLDLNSIDPRIVLEATLNATDSTCSVKASYSNDFYDTTKNGSIDSLNIILIAPDNTQYELKQNNEGIYFVQGVIANTNDIFSIKVTDKEGNEYMASAKTPSDPNQFLVLFSTPENFEPTVTDSTGEEKKLMFALAYWMDNSSQEDYYRFKLYKEGQYIADNYSFVSDETAVGDTMQIGFSEFFTEDDTITVELLTINKETYDYYQQLMDIQYAGMNSTSPYNPKGNFSNEALGYFCIQKVRTQNFVVFEFPFVFK